MELFHIDLTYSIAWLNRMVTITLSKIQQDMCTKTTLEEHAVYFFASTGGGGGGGRVSPFSINLIHLH